MRYVEIISEGRDAPLFRGYKDKEFAIKAIEDNEIVGSTTQRFWPDGKRRKDNEPDYQSSYWMKGASFTRDFNYAASWGCVVLEIDQIILTQRTKIMPLNWGYSIPSGNDHKREREEFAITKKTPDTYNDIDADGEEIPTKFNYKRFSKPEGAIKNLDKMLLGIYVDWRKMDHPEKIKILLDHPKFKGLYKIRDKTAILLPRNIVITPEDVKKYWDTWKLGD
jgi:hypothetical protein